MPVLARKHRARRDGRRARHRRRARGHARARAFSSASARRTAWTFAAVAVVLLGVTLLASYLPSRRGRTRVDPLTVLQGVDHRQSSNRGSGGRRMDRVDEGHRRVDDREHRPMSVQDSRRPDVDAPIHRCSAIARSPIVRFAMVSRLAPPRPALRYSITAVENSARAGRPGSGSSTSSRPRTAPDATRGCFATAPPGSIHPRRAVPVLHLESGQAVERERHRRRRLGRRAIAVLHGEDVDFVDRFRSVEVDLQPVGPRVRRAVVPAPPAPQLQPLAVAVDRPGRRS